jgi:uncharacterized repeat protein (TIGR01451 family)
MRHLVWLVIPLLAVAGVARAQPLAPQPVPAPLMYLRFAGPRDAKITIYRGTGAGQMLELPCTVGFRPGYSYRIAVSDMAAFPRQVFCPSIEVRGTLGLISKLRNADFPAQINFAEEDFHKALGGTLIKKVVILERPDQAIPVASLPDAPLEVPVAPLRDPLIEGAQQGLPLVIVQMGQRFFSPQELNSLAVPGTVLMPGERILGLPRVPPWLGWNWCPVYDPVLGPRNPAEFMTLYDGGDSGPTAGVSRNGKLRGLDATDTVAEYTNRFGEKRLAVSNRVALCIPRFVIYKGEIAAFTQIARQTVSNTHTLKTPSASVGQLSMKEQTQQQHAEGVDAKLRASGAYIASTTAVFGRMLGLEVKSTLRNSAAVDKVMTSPPSEAADGPLRIIKWPDKTGALVGDVITFYLKYTNSGGQPITNVMVSDSLTARFEYVKGSTKTDRDALFTIQPNEVGSAVLRWEFTGALQAHEHGVISFQVRVR